VGPVDLSWLASLGTRRAGVVRGLAGVVLLSSSPALRQICQIEQRRH
jgi:hypothetical protein